MDGYLYRNGYCPMSDDKGSIGLIDKTGKWVVAPIYDMITPTSSNYWVVMKATKYGILSDSLKNILPCNKYYAFVTKDKEIDVIDSDNVNRIYNLNGTIKIDVACCKSNKLTYEEGLNSENNEPMLAYAKCKSYSNGNGKEGLLGIDGKPITKPIYNNIEAIENDLYLCTFDCGTGVIIDGTGMQIK